MGVDPKTVDFPAVNVVSVQEMSIVMCGVVDPKCPVMPAVYDGQTFYVMEGLDFTRNREYSSFIVHHMVHVVQYTKLGKDPAKMKQYMPQYEQEALEHQRRWLSLEETNLK